MKDKTNSLYHDMQRYIAVTAIGPSTLRNQGAPGVIAAAQCFLSNLALRTFTVKNEKAFLAVLDATTNELRRSLPSDSQHWGAARKGLNLFLRDICYNRFLSQRHSMGRLEPWMEIPLDSVVAAALKKHIGKGRLPSWPGLKRLTPSGSFLFQDVARQWADAEHISRVHLDMRIWVKQRTKLAK